MNKNNAIYFVIVLLIGIFVLGYKYVGQLEETREADIIEQNRYKLLKARERASMDCDEWFEETTLYDDPIVRKALEEKINKKAREENINIVDAMKETNAELHEACVSDTLETWGY